MGGNLPSENALKLLAFELGDKETKVDVREVWSKCSSKGRGVASFVAPNF